MTTDKEYTDMGMCPNCLAEGYDGCFCDKCGNVSTSGESLYGPLRNFDKTS